MSGQVFLDRLKHQFGDAVTGANLTAIDPWIEVAPEGLVDVCRYLRDEPDLRFDLLNCISGVDYFEPDAKKAAKLDWQPHLEVVYHLSSLANKTNLVVKVFLPRWKDDQPGELPEVPSVACLWSTADWHEREMFDLVGVRFTGHPDLRRILVPRGLGRPPAAKGLRDAAGIPRHPRAVRLRFCDRPL